MRTREWNASGVLVLLACLLVAGLIGAATPTQLPSARPVVPDSDGVARTARLDAELLEVTQTAAIVSEMDTQYDTREAFMVVTYWAQPHRDITIMRPSLVTRDGTRYSPYSRVDIVPHASAVVGQAVRAMVAFELPADLIAGAQVEIVALQRDGISGVVDTPTFAFPDPVPISSEPVSMLPVVTEAGR